MVVRAIIIQTTSSTDSVIPPERHRHFDYGDILLMPTVNEVSLDRGYAASFVHKRSARAGYYSVKLDNGIWLN